MKTRIAYWWEIIQSTFWLLPGVISISLIALALVVEPIERAAPGLFGAKFFLRTATLEGTRLILSSIATAVMTVVGVLFSITVVVLQQVSQQYSPRVLDIFIRSPVNQTVLGVYIGTFGYALLILGTVQGNDIPGGNIARLGPTLAILLALGCLGLLIYYVHHLARSIKSNMILAAISRETKKTLADLERDLDLGGDEATEMKARNLPHRFTYHARRDGYLQEMNWWKIQRLFRSVRWSGETMAMPGDYIHTGMPLLHVASAAPLSKRQKEKIGQIFTIDLVRTHSQDPRFGIRQMVDIALKALSPGVNDPTTAVEALNEISTVLGYYTRNCITSGDLRFPDGSRLRVRESSYREMVDLCVNEIALAGKSFHLVQKAVLKTVDVALRSAGDPVRVHILKEKRRELEKMALDAPGRHLFEASVVPPHPGSLAEGGGEGCDEADDQGG